MIQETLLCVISALLGIILSFGAYAWRGITKRLDNVESVMSSMKSNISSMKLAQAKSFLMNSYAHRNKLMSMNPIVPNLGNDITKWARWSVNYLGFIDLDVNRKGEIIWRR